MRCNAQPQLYRTSDTVFGGRAAPGLFLLSRPWDWLLAGALVASAARRGAAGLQTLRYRANLSRQRRYEVTSTEIP